MNIPRGRSELKGGFMQLSRQSGEHHSVGSMADVEQALLFIEELPEFLWKPASRSEPGQAPPAVSPGAPRWSRVQE